MPNLVESSHRCLMVRKQGGKGGGKGGGKPRIIVVNLSKMSANNTTMIATMITMAISMS